MSTECKRFFFQGDFWDAVKPNVYGHCLAGVADHVIIWQHFPNKIQNKLLLFLTERQILVGSIVFMITKTDCCCY